MGKPDSDVSMLASALAVPADTIGFHSREPLGAGSVTGLQVADEPAPYYVDTSGLEVPAETGLRSSEDAGAVRIWQHPADPHLPALAPVAFDSAAQTLLARLGIHTDARPEIVAYRPGRRAVLRIGSGAARVWLKVVRPSRVDRIVRAHAAAERSGLPVPPLHAWSGDGLIVMAQASGTPAQDVEWDPADLIDRVEHLRALLAQVEWTHAAPGIAARLDWYAERADDGTQALLTAARGLIESEQAAAPAVVHGDLHFGQLFLDAGLISGMIDIDTLAVGDPAEDPAAFLSHATASALLTRGPAQSRAWELADLAAERWGTARVRGLVVVHLAGHIISAAERGDQAYARGLTAAASAIVNGGRPSAPHG
ncbi:phosphotransferase family protein [Microbacterium tenebrionis]|uniref:phosphotransferase family protein n=1 Tax=Microbacterium tenebrionis TaxID=2830665 RepID=UPI00158A5F8E|nr:phosphotransferase [Microbacterium ihumii]